MSSRLVRIHLNMFFYGSLFGFAGGGILGAGFVALTYNPFFEMNILLVAVGALATMLVGLTFGAVAGFLSGIALTVISPLFTRHPQIHKAIAGLITASITLMLFFQTAYLVGRPFIYDTTTYPSWIWAGLVAVIGAFIVSTQAINTYNANAIMKRKHTV